MNPMIRIGINGFYLSAQFAGIGQYSINLLRSLAEIDKEKKSAPSVIEIEERR
jgi:hypothetical protein